VLLIRRIRELLYGEGFTISGARHRLEDDSHPNIRSTVPADAMNIAGLRREIKEIIALLSI
jgi:hypothetical protein